MNLALWTILVLAIPLVAGKAVDGVYLGFLALVILASFEALQPLAQAFQFLGHSVAAGERLFDVIDVAPQVLDCPAPLPKPPGHTLEFDQVHFAYSEAEVLDGISFTVRPGSRVAVVGPSGSGKSTLARLAAPFSDPPPRPIPPDAHRLTRYSLR